MNRKIWLAGLFAFVVFAFTDCGRRGAPRPPEENAPQAVQYLSARGAVRAVTLSWQAPLETASGGDLKDLASFVIQRRDVIGTTTNRFEDVGIVPIEPDQDLKKAQFTFSDPSAVAGRKYDYIVFGKKGDGLEGETDKVLRVTFKGETSAIEVMAPDAAPK